MGIMIRPQRPEEYAEGNRITEICFHVPAGVLDPAKDNYRIQESTDWGAFLENKMIAQLRCYMSPAFLWGKEIPDGRIGFVSTLPEYRGRGAVRMLFQRLMQEMLEKGAVISTLNPFNPAYYRQFGYETVCRYSRYRFPSDLLRGYRFEKEAVRWQAGDPAEPYLELYRRFVSRYQFAHVRSLERMMNFRLKKGGGKGESYAYLLKQNGKDLAYIVYDALRENGKAVLKVQETVWDGPEGFEAVLGFLSCFDSDYQEIDLLLPADVEFYQLVRTSKAREIRKETCQLHMVRVLDVKKALELMVRPADTDIVLKVEDAFLPENSGCWRLTGIGAGKEAPETEPDISVSITDLSLLATGAISLREAELRTGVKIFKKHEMLERVFVRRPVYYNEDL